MVCSPLAESKAVTSPLKYLCSSGDHTPRRQSTASLPWGPLASAFWAAATAARALAASAAFWAAISLAFRALALASSALTWTASLDWGSAATGAMAAVAGAAAVISASTTSSELVVVCCSTSWESVRWHTTSWRAKMSWSGVLGHWTFLMLSLSSLAPETQVLSISMEVASTLVGELTSSLSRTDREDLGFLRAAPGSRLQSAATLLPLGMVLPLLLLLLFCFCWLCLFFLAFCLAFCCSSMWGYLTASFLRCTRCCSPSWYAMRCFPLAFSYSLILPTYQRPMAGQ